MAIVKNPTPLKKELLSEYRDILANELGREVTMVEAGKSFDSFISTIAMFQFKGYDVSIKGFGRFGTLTREYPDGTKTLNARFKPSRQYRDQMLRFLNADGTVKG